LTKLRPEAVRLFSESLGPEDKVLITGASGWFGKTAIALTKTTGVTYLATGSRPRVIEIDGNKEKVESHDLDLISAFQPTVVIDAAFLTRDKLSLIGAERYVKINRTLLELSIEIAGLDSVRKYVGFSSGAAVHLAGQTSFNVSENPYAALKRDYEERVLRIGKTLKASISIPRVFSVTGAYVTKPNLFAFSNIILQAMSGEIEIQAKNRVFRRYAPVEDVIAVATSQKNQNAPIVFDTGGELLEIGELAKMASVAGGTGAEIFRTTNPKMPDDNYFSNGKDWTRVSAEQNLPQLGARQQVEMLAAFMTK